MYIRKFILFSVGFLVFSCASKQDNISESPADGKFYYEMGVSSLNAGNNAQAIYYLLQAVQTYRKPEVYNALALAYQFSGEYTKAEEVFKEGIGRFGDNPELITNLGVLYALTNREKEAISLLEKSATHPTYQGKDKAYYNLALIYRNLGNDALFLENINRSLLYNSNFASSYLALGDYYYERYLKSKDIDYLKQSLSNYLKVAGFGLSSPELFYKIGRIYIVMKEKELARYYLEKALKVTEDKDPMKNHIKQLLIDLTEDKFKEEF